MKRERKLTMLKKLMINDPQHYDYVDLVTNDGIGHQIATVFAPSQPSKDILYSARRLVAAWNATREASLRDLEAGRYSICSQIQTLNTCLRQEARIRELERQIENANRNALTQVIDAVIAEFVQDGNA
jgi:hypothetical protein